MSSGIPSSAFSQFGAHGFASGAAVWRKGVANAGCGATSPVIPTGFGSGFRQFGQHKHARACTCDPRTAPGGPRAVGSSRSTIEQLAVHLALLHVCIVSRATIRAAKPRNCFHMSWHKTATPWHTAYTWVPSATQPRNLRTSSSTPQQSVIMHTRAMTLHGTRYKRPAAAKANIPAETTAATIATVI
jgi:hypothetical protein